MVDVRAEAVELLDERPESEAVLEHILEVDAEVETWTFDDLEIDSGMFGEIVARDLVEKTDGAYRVRDREAVRAALRGEKIEASSAFDWREYINIPAVDPRTVIGLVAALAFLFLMRILQYRSVFRDEHVVSPGNDPYFYRYMMGELLEISSDPWSTEVIANMPARALSRRPFTHAANWWIAALFGGDPGTAALVAAWLPVVATVFLGLAVYGTAWVLTRDVRVGLAAVFVLALTPVHAVYSGLGFLEHRLHQYLWLGVTLLCLCYLALDVERRREQGSSVGGHLRSPLVWVAALGLVPGIAFSVMAWGGSVMMLIPLAVYIGLRTVLDVRTGISPGVVNLPVLVGVSLATSLIAFLHFRWGWHDPFVAYIALLVVIGTVGVLGLGELWRVADWPLGGLGGVQGLIGAGGILGFRHQYPGVWEQLRERADDVFYREGATETAGLMSDDFDFFFGPIFQVGADFLLGLVVLGWAAVFVWRHYQPGWLVILVYAGVWFVFAVFQTRFAAQLSIIWAIASGLGFVYFLAWMDLVRIPRPFREADDGVRTEANQDNPSIALPRSRDAALLLIVMIVLVGGVGFAFVPLLGADVAYSDAEYEAMQAIDAYAAEIEGQEEFVLSRWGENRMFNHLVFGEGRSYGYAGSHFESMVLAEDPGVAFADYEGSVGYLVVHDLGQAPSNTVYATLHGEADPGDGTLPDVANYQALYLDDEVSAYALLPGATIVTNETDADTASTTVSVDGVDYTYERAFGGSDNVTVAYPGEYTVDETTVEITSEDVTAGKSVTVYE